VEGGVYDIRALGNGEVVNRSLAGMGVMLYDRLTATGELSIYRATSQLYSMKDINVSRVECLTYCL